MLASNGDLKARLEALLRSESDRGQLLRELERLAQEADFAGLARLWAPALVERHALFFEPFLSNQLSVSRHRGHAAVIRSLLPTLEAREHDTLFRRLYPQVVDERGWNKELMALAESPQPDERVYQAVGRRNQSANGFSLDEPTALALYRRNPTLARDFIRAHVRHTWRRPAPRHRQLRAEIGQQGDDDLAWALFRELADEAEWEQALRKLLSRPVPAEQIVAELKRRHPAHVWQADADLLVALLKQYGTAVVPYFEEQIWLARRTAARLLAAIERLGDSGLYWRLFFRLRWPHEGQRPWNEAIRALLTQPLNDEALALALQLRTPPASPGRWSWWRLDDDVAEALYRRQPQRFRLFLEQVVTEPSLTLFQLAEEQRDEEFLDVLTFRLLRQVSALAYRVASDEHALRRHKDDRDARQLLERISGAVTARFDRLYAASPATYVEHAANILGRAVAYEVWSLKHELARNPIYGYLAQQHPAAWLTAPRAIRDLLESPSIHVQIIGLEMLTTGGPAAAERVLENLDLLRALLLSRARLRTKRLALRCLEGGAAQHSAHAGRILPLLEEMMDYRGKRSIDERIMVSFVRLRRLSGPPPSAAPLLPTRP